MVSNGPKWSQMVPNGLKLSQMVLHGLTWSPLFPSSRFLVPLNVLTMDAKSKCVIFVFEPCIFGEKVRKFVRFSVRLTFHRGIMEWQANISLEMGYCPLALDFSKMV